MKIKGVISINIFIITFFMFFQVIYANNNMDFKNQSRWPNESKYYLTENGDLFLRKVFEDDDTPELIQKNVKKVILSSALADCDKVYIIKDDNSLWGRGTNIYNYKEEPKCYERFEDFQKIEDDIKEIYIDESNFFYIKTDDTLWHSNNNNENSQFVKIMDNCFSLILGAYFNPETSGHILVTDNDKNLYNYDNNGSFTKIFENVKKVDSKTKDIFILDKNNNLYTYNRLKEENKLGKEPKLELLLSDVADFFSVDSKFSYDTENKEKLAPVFVLRSNGLVSYIDENKKENNIMKGINKIVKSGSVEMLTSSGEMYRASVKYPIFHEGKGMYEYTSETGESLETYSDAAIYEKPVLVATGVKEMYARGYYLKNDNKLYNYENEEEFDYSNTSKYINNILSDNSNKSTLNENINISEIDSPSDWAIDEINESKSLGIIPEELRSKYTEAITRKDFCKLIVNTLAV